MINALALVGVIAIAIIAAREIRWLWKARKWKPTPFLLPVRPPW
jgi:hypothetical protein